jgi:hypothetical protein
MDVLPDGGTRAAGGPGDAKRQAAEYRRSRQADDEQKRAMMSRMTEPEIASTSVVRLGGAHGFAVKHRCDALGKNIQGIASPPFSPLP